MYGCKHFCTVLQVKKSDFRVHMMRKTDIFGKGNEGMEKLFSWKKEVWIMKALKQHFKWNKLCKFLLNWKNWKLKKWKLRKWFYELPLEAELPRQTNHKVKDKQIISYQRKKLNNIFRKVKLKSKLKVNLMDNKF